MINTQRAGIVINGDEVMPVIILQLYATTATVLRDGLKITVNILKRALNNIKYLKKQLT